MSTPRIKRCLHETLPLNIHEFVLTEVSPFAVEEMFAITYAILDRLPSPTSYPVLIDTRVGIQPLGLVFTKMRELARLYPNRERNRVALILTDKTVYRMIDIFMRPFGAIRFFTPTQREEALTWLREKQEVGIGA